MKESYWDSHTPYIGQLLKINPETNGAQDAHYLKLVASGKSFFKIIGFSDKDMAYPELEGLPGNKFIGRFLPHKKRKIIL